MCTISRFNKTLKELLSKCIKNFFFKADILKRRFPIYFNEECCKHVVKRYISMCILPSDS